MTSSEYRQPYPSIEPYASGMLPVSDGHTIYYEECGNPDGKPVVIVHGGPGGGCNAGMRRLHDPKAYRIILFDQRGCGRSTPYASLENNTTWHLVADMERLREHLGIERWQVWGGSWGSTLSLAYGECHPDRASELILRGIFTLRREELLWFYQYGAHALYPDAWEGYVAPIPEVERDDMMGAYYKRLTGDDPEEQLACAQAWSMWEGSTISLRESADRVAAFGRERYALAFARIECHYFVNGGFLERDDQLIADVGKVRDIPGVIVQGRHDVVTPMMTAWDLSRAWPEADFRIVPDAGHALTEPGITYELLTASDGFR
ncbi:MAG: prolyl aminopeptidase [Parvularculales bacterium]